MASNVVSIDLVVHGEHQTERALKRVDDSADHAGDSLKKMGEDAGFLDRELDKLRASHIDLVKQLDKTSNIDLLKALRKSRRQVRVFEGLKAELEKQLQDEVDKTDWAKQVGGPLVKGIGRAFAAAPGPLKVGLVGLAISALPFLGAAIAGTVLGAAGAGGIIGGLALAAFDPRVREGFRSLGQEAKAAFSVLGDDFAAPALESIRILKAGVRDIADTIGRELKPIVSSLGPGFVQGVVGLVENTVEGIAEALNKAEPAIRALSSELPKIGDAIGNFFDEISDESDGATLGFLALSRLLRATITGAGILLGKLSAIYEWSVRANAKFTGLFEDVVGWVPILGDNVRSANDEAEGLLAGLDRAKDGSHDFAGGLDEVGDSADDAAEKLEKVGEELDRIFGNTMDLDRATIAYERSLDDLVETLQDGTRTLDVNSEAGQENRDAMLDNIQAIKNLRDANVNNKMAVEEANSIYDQQLEQLRRTAYSLGFNKQQVDALIDSYKAIPARAEVEVRAPGLLAAIAQAKELARLLGSNVAAANAAGNADTYVSGRWAGGPVMPGQTYVVGENGPEVLKMGATGGYVYAGNGTGGPAAVAAMPASPSGPSATTATAVVEPSGSAAIDQIVAFLMPYIIKRIRINGGNTGLLGA